MQRYFSEIINSKVNLNDVDKNHFLKVMRAQPGENVEIVFNKKVYLCTLNKINPLNISVLKELDEDHELKIDLVLLVSLLKGEKMDLVIQKACEIGASEIILVRSERSIVKINKNDEKAKLERFQRIVKEAAQQSKRNVVPTIDKVLDYKDIASLEAQYKFIGAVNDKMSITDLKNNMDKVNSGDKVMILIGPEGGFSDDEVEYATKNNFKAVSFGRRVLRAETACISSLSIISYLFEAK